MSTIKKRNMHRSSFSYYSSISTDFGTQFATTDISRFCFCVCYVFSPAETEHAQNQEVFTFPLPLNTQGHNADTHILFIPYVATKCYYRSSGTK